MTTRWIVTALGKDQPGIVAGVTRALFQLGCNLEDSAMTRLEGEFTIMLIFSSPAGVTLQVLRQAFESIERRLKLAVHLKPLTRAETGVPRRRGKPYLISVYGADRPGIVFRITEALAQARINITDVATHRSVSAHRGKQPSLYLMLLEVEVPARLPRSFLQVKLTRLAKALGVQVSMRPIETEVL